MKLEFYPVEKLKKEILEIIGRYLDFKKYKVFFFGSRVKEISFPRSDIDIGILGPKEIPAKIKLEIEEEIENLPTLYKIDIVDFKEVSDKFKKEALKNIEYVK
jgi:predicted nucleotidyltransferase